MTFPAKTTTAFLFACATLMTSACSSDDDPAAKPAGSAPGNAVPNHPDEKPAAAHTAAGIEKLPMDSHSQSQPNEVRVKHARLDLTLDFAKKIIHGSVALEFTRLNEAAPLILDTDDLTIESVAGVDGKQRPFTLGKKDPMLGTALSIQLAGDDKEVTVRYATSPKASALQWLSKDQTYSRKGEYLYTQGEAILTRSWIPLQDTPGVRMTYAAKITAPKEMRVVMSADVRKDVSAGVYSFAMDKPVPCYLIALACGHIEFAKISDRCGVFADPMFLKKAVAEFSDTETMLEKCEEKFGPYVWGRYDILVLPPAFPFGGMENPTLTFATPTIVTGDKSLVSLIAHEMAHSWSGNLVTNATWRDFWLNEGFTVYLEQRIMELVYGYDRAEMEIATATEGLKNEAAELPAADQILHIDLTGRNPDDGMTAIAYDKGAAFLRRLEIVFGRKVFDAFLQGYFETYAFQSITTDDFLKYLDAHLLQTAPEKAKKVDVHKWVFEPGLPKTMIDFTPKSFAEVDEVRNVFLNIRTFPPRSPHQKWNYHQWLYFLNKLPANTDANPDRLEEDYFQQIDRVLLRNPNPEIRCAFLTQAMRQGHYIFTGEAMEFLENMGRRKFILPIIKEMVKTAQGKQHAQEIYDAIAPQLHSITLHSLNKIMGKK